MFSEDLQPTWNLHEMQLLNHREVFLHKPGIMKKAESRLGLFKNAMAQELAERPAPWPAGTDTTDGQLARGENNKGFPFLSLDIPQKFSKTEMFTLRTLFWWGHYLGFFLILKGESLEAWLDQLIACRSVPGFDGVVLSTWPTPWEWSQEHFIAVSSAPADEISRIVLSHAYIKIGRVFPLDDPGFAELDWTVAGLSAWRTLSGIARR